MSTYITKLNESLDLICYERYGTTSNRIVEWVFDQNPGIEVYGMLLPLGIVINLPEAPKQLTKPKVVPQIFLWS